MSHYINALKTLLVKQQYNHFLEIYKLFCSCLTHSIPQGLFHPLTLILLAENTLQSTLYESQSDLSDFKLVVFGLKQLFQISSYKVFTNERSGKNRSIH